MNGNERREQILKILKTQNAPISGTELAKRFSLSRQVIVQDIAILRANGAQIESIHSGYILKKENGFTSLTLLLTLVQGWRMCSYIIRCTALLKHL